VNDLQACIEVVRQKMQVPNENEFIVCTNYDNDAGGLDDQEITIEIPAEYLKTDKGQVFAMGNMFPGNNDGSTPQHVTNLMNLFKPGKENKKRKKMKISEAKTILEEVEIDTLLEDVDLKAESVQRAEESGIVFLDEIDKVSLQMRHAF